MAQPEAHGATVRLESLTYQTVRYLPANCATEFQKENFIRLRRRTAQLLVQPSAGIRPVPIGRAHADPQSSRRLLNGQAGKEAQFHHFPGDRFLLGQPLQGLIQSQQFFVRSLVHDVQPVEVAALPAAAMAEALLASGVLDENAPHPFGGGGKEMSPAVPVLRLLLIHEPEIGLVNQRRGLERLAWGFAGQPLGGQLRSSSYTSGSNWAAACGSPCSMADRMCVISVTMAPTHALRQGARFGPDPDPWSAPPMPTAPCFTLSGALCPT